MYSIFVMCLKMIVRACPPDTSSVTSMITKLIVKVIAGRLFLLIVASGLLIIMPRWIRILLILHILLSIIVLFIG